MARRNTQRINTDIAKMEVKIEQLKTSIKEAAERRDTLIAERDAYLNQELAGVAKSHGYTSADTLEKALENLKSIIPENNDKGEAPDED